MTVPAAPVITAITLSTDAADAGDPIQVSVTWTGFPTRGVSYQWRLGSTPIRGETAAVYTPPDRPEDLNCLITIDNGRGTAMSASLYVTFGPAPEFPTNSLTADGEPMTAGGDWLTAGE